MAGSRKRRAVLLVENLPVPLDRRVWQEATALADAGWDVTVIGPLGDNEMHRLRAVKSGVEILRYPQRAASGLAGYLVEYFPSLVFTAMWLVWLRLRGRIDVIHGCNPPDLFWLFGRLGSLWGSRYVFDQHDANPELAETKFGSSGMRGKLLGRLTRWLESQSYRAATAVLVPNDSYARIVAERGGRSDAVVVRNAPDVREYRGFAHGVEPHPLRVGYVGVMGSQDGVDVLLEAWAALVREPDMADAHLEIVGDGEARRQLENMAERLRIADRVTFHGYLRPASFVPILASCAVCVSPDPPTPFNSVSTMVKVIDYLAIGRPIVSFDLRETRLAAGAAVTIVDTPTAAGLAQGLLQLLRDSNAVENAAQATAARVARLELDWSVSARRLVETYRRVIDSSGSRDGLPTPR